MNIFTYPDGTYRARVELTRLTYPTTQTETRWATLRKVGNTFGFTYISEWPDHDIKDYSEQRDSYICENYETKILQLGT